MALLWLPLWRARWKPIRSKTLIPSSAVTLGILGISHGYF